MMKVGWRSECRWLGCRVADGICVRRHLGAVYGLLSLKCWGVTAGKARYNSRNVRDVTADRWDTNLVSSKAVCVSICPAVIIATKVSRPFVLGDVAP